VSSAYGATDDGVGCVTVLQLIDYFTTPGRQPKKGIVALLNNGEEDFLWGARAFRYHPMHSFVHTFVNLEGAGAGGRAILFRTSDHEVTQAYASTPNPFGSVIASDGFKLGMIKSETDYAVFNGIYHQRGLDIAFYRPRSRYHTNQDDARHTSKGSVWHMLSAAVAATKYLSGDTGDTFTVIPPGKDGDRTWKRPSSDGVWFDLFGKFFAAFPLRGLFAWSISLLVATPLTFALLMFLISKSGKDYYFTDTFDPHADDGHTSDQPILIRGWRGLFRFPLALVMSGGLVVGSAFLVKKFNPFIIYSSEYVV
jgi:hypothetical protein